jgi:Tol biopolymer transport system component
MNSGFIVMKPFFRWVLAPFLMGSALLSAGTATYTARFDYDSRLVFSSDFEGNEELYLLTKEGLTRLTTNPAIDHWPVPDPAGERIVFASDREGNFDIFTMDLRTRAIRRLTSDPRDEMAPSWSADGLFVYYDLAVRDNSTQTMKLDVRTGKSEILLPDPPFSSTIVAFENGRGDAVYFTGKVFLGWLVAKYDLKSRRYTELTKKGSCRPKVSPDSRRIAYVCHDDDGLGDIFLMNADGGGKVNRTPGRMLYHDYYPCFSPSGDMIVFSSSPKTKGKNAYQLYTLNLETGEIRSIFTSPGNNRFPYWFR